MDTPLFSIVIANYNYGRFLEEAIQSVIAQNMGNRLELIICDASSTDNSVEIIKKYVGGLPPNTSRSEWADPNSKFQTPNSKLITWWCSEKDGGQSAAFNKGFSHARGRFLTWLNADDILLPGALAGIEKAILKHPKGRWFVGGSVWGDGNLRLQRCFKAHVFSRLRANAGCLMVGGPSSFFEKTLWEEVGGVDEELHYVMDIDLWYRFYINARQIYYRTSKYVWAFRIHDDSKMSGPTLNPDSAENKRKRAKLFQEGCTLKDRYGFGVASIGRKIGVWLSTSFVDKVLAIIDERRFRGKDVRTVGSESGT